MDDGDWEVKSTNIRARTPGSIDVMYEYNGDMKGKSFIYVRCEDGLKCSQPHAVHQVHYLQSAMC